MNGTTRAPGKLILLGEYAVLRGAPALVTAVGRYARVHFRQISQPHICLSAPEIGVRNVLLEVNSLGQVRFIQPQPPEIVRHTIFVRAALEVAWQWYREQEVAFPAFELDISTSEFFTANGQKLGLGSSAAVTVAILAGLLKNLIPGEPKSSPYVESLLLAALQAHQRAQGRMGSGVDIAASTLGRSLVYRMPPIPNTLPATLEYVAIPMDLHMVFVWTGQSAATMKMLRRIETFRQQCPEEHAQLFAELMALSEQGAEAFVHQQVEAFLQIVERYYQMLVKLTEKSQAPIISGIHRDIAQRLQKRGVAYKPSGAGGGDFGIVFSADLAEIEQVRKILTSAGYHLFDFAIDAEGVLINS